MFDLDTKCYFCKEGKETDNYCEEKVKYGYVCTRVKGHKGDHVACGTIDHDFVRKRR